MQIFAEIGPVYLVLAAVIAVFAGFVKGAVGFALPMVMISGLGSFLAPEIALAALILPAVTTNLIQSGAAQPHLSSKTTQGYWLRNPFIRSTARRILSWLLA